MLKGEYEGEYESEGKFDSDPDFDDDPDFGGNHASEGGPTSEGSPTSDIVPASEEDSKQVQRRQRFIQIPRRFSKFDMLQDTNIDMKGKSFNVPCWYTLSQ